MNRVLGMLRATWRVAIIVLIVASALLGFATALGLPVFEVQGLTLLKRLTLIAHDGVIEHVFYPVFPPDRNADDVIEWLKGHHANQSGKP